MSEEPGSTSCDSFTIKCVNAWSQSGALPLFAGMCNVIGNAAMRAASDPPSKWKSPPTSRTAAPSPPKLSTDRSRSKCFSIKSPICTCGEAGFVANQMPRTVGQQYHFALAHVERFTTGGVHPKLPLLDEIEMCSAFRKRDAPRRLQACRIHQLTTQPDQRQHVREHINPRSSHPVIRRNPGRLIMKCGCSGMAA